MIAEANDIIGMLRAKRLQYARSRSWSSLPLSGRSHARHCRSADALATETTEANDIIGILRAQALQYMRAAAAGAARYSVAAAVQGTTTVPMSS